MLAGTDPAVWMALGFGFGLYSFFRGFKVYREYRVVEDTPQAPLRSVAMGLVCVQGTVSGPEQVTSPITRTACYYYRVDIQKWQSAGSQGGYWRHYHTDAGGVRFLLTDPSGSVLVDASGAELDLAPACERRARNTPFLGIGGATKDLDLLAYITRLGSAAGTASMEPAAELADGAALVHGSFRLKELCIVPGRDYTITGTCIENPDARNEHDRNLIVKGPNEPTYLISEKPLASLESSLRGRSTLMVFGGAALAVVCLGLLLIRLRLW